MLNKLVACFATLLFLSVLQAGCGWSVRHAVRKGDGASHRKVAISRHNAATEPQGAAAALDQILASKENQISRGYRDRTLLKSGGFGASDKLSLSPLGERSSKRQVRHVAKGRSKRASESDTRSHHSSPAEPLSEPKPEFQDAAQKWSWAWDLHIYLFAGLFWLLTLVSLISTVANSPLCADLRKANTTLKLSLHLFLLLFSVTRALCLSVDPYGSRHVMGSMVTYILWSAGFPIIVTSFGLLLLVLLDTTKLNLAPPRFHNRTLAIGIMMTNFTVVMVTDLTVLLSAGSRVMMIICHVYLMTAGLSYTTIIHVADNKLTRLRYLISTSAGISLALFGVQIYAAVAVFGIYSDSPEMSIEPWPWYAVQTCLRSLEVGMCVVITALFLSSSSSSNNHKNWLVFLRLPCIGTAKVSPAMNDCTSKQEGGMDTKL